MTGTPALRLLENDDAIPKTSATGPARLSTKDPISILKHYREIGTSWWSGHLVVGPPPSDPVGRRPGVAKATAGDNPQAVVEDRETGIGAS